MNISTILGKRKHEIIRDKNGRPNYVFKLEKFNWDPVNGFNSTEVHPAFVVNGTVVDAIYIGQYQAIIYDPTTFAIQGDTDPASSSSPYVAGSGHDFIAQSIPNQDPRVKIDFDAARKACANMNGNGVNGWHLMSNAEWAALALWAQAHEMPLGNNSYGDDYSDPTVKGIMAPGNNFNGPNPSRWLTGSGGLKTAHDRTRKGVFDLNGNVWEWVDGLKLVDGKIFVAGNLNSSPSGIGNSFQAAEADWFDTGMFVYWDGSSTIIEFSSVDRGVSMDGQDPNYKAMQFDDIQGADDNLKKLAIGPVQTGLNKHGGDHTWWRNYAERVPLRGGGWSYGSYAGMFTLYLFVGRGSHSWTFGFRPAFVAL